MVAKLLKPLFERTKTPMEFHSVGSGQDVDSIPSSDQPEPLLDDFHSVGSHSSSTKSHSRPDSKGNDKSRLEMRRAVGEPKNSSSLPRLGMTNPKHPSVQARQGFPDTNTWDAKGPARRIFPNSCDISNTSQMENTQTSLRGPLLCTFELCLQPY